MKTDKIMTRDTSVDIVKALGIICMVAGHSGSPITKFVYLFHMAIFFIASGYCYTSKKTDDKASLIDFVKRKFKSLWFPYVLWTAIYSLLHNFFIYVNIYTDNPLILQYVSGPYISTTETWSLVDVLKNIVKACALHGGTQIGGAFWFIATLMEISLAYGILDFIIKKLFKQKYTIMIQTILSILFLFFGYGCFLTDRSFGGIDKVLSFYFLFHGGFLLKKYGISCKERKKYTHALILTVSFIVLVFCNKIGEIHLALNSYENPIYFFVVSFVGWQFLYELAFWIQKNSLLKKLNVIIGQNTISVVILHFLCFKIVNCIYVLIKGEPLCLVAAFPILVEGGCWWIAYTAVGLCIPIALSIIWKAKSKGV